jgi:hypothetical protein
VAVAVLVVLPVLVYAVPAMLGHPVVPGDDATQNLPLRVLVGRDLRQGHLPIFDPYLWSGAPLLAGWNAGAAYPLTWLFAIVPAAGAWAVNLVAASAVAGVGCYCFLRASRLGVTASWLGGLTFAFGGAMVAQIAHLGLIVGMSWVPLALLAILRLTDPGSSGLVHRLVWMSALAVAIGLVILAGEPRAIANAAAVLAVYGIWRIGRVGWTGEGVRAARAASIPGAGETAGATGLRHQDRKWTGPTLRPLQRLGGRTVVVASATVAAGTALGIGLGAVQLLPGLAAVASSQRSQVTATLFSSGSLPVRWLLLVGVPDLLGGSGSWGQPAFFATYNLTEVTAYVGVLPLMAAGALLGRLRLRRPLPEWLVWYAVGAVGILLALGSNTPLWHLLIKVPLFSGQRLQSRSIMITDLALAVLLAHWVDGWLAARRIRTSGGPGTAATQRREAVLAAVPALGVAGVVVVALVWEPGFLAWMGVARSTADRVGGLKPWLVPELVLAVVAAALVWSGRRLDRRWRQALVGAFVVTDLVTFVLLTVLAVGTGTTGTGTAVGTNGTSTVPTATASDAAPAHGTRVRPTGTSPDHAVRPISTLHVRGRFAIYDPTLLDTGQLSDLGAPDQNALSGTYSVQGYGSIVDGAYARATGTHQATGTGQDVFSANAAADGTLDELDTTAILVPAPYLVTEPGAGGPPPGAGTGRRHLSPGRTTTWYLGTPLKVSSVSVAQAARTPAAAGTGSSGALMNEIRLGLVTSSGRTIWLATGRSGGRVPSTWRVTTPGVEAVAVVARSTGRAIQLDDPAVETAGGDRYEVDGRLESAIVPPRWSYAGRDGAFAIFEDQRARPPLQLRALPGRTLEGTSVRRVSGPAVQPESAAVTSPRGVEVVRAVADIPGWTASWAPAAGGAPRALAVRADGIVQAVTVPAGSGIVTWRYVAPELTIGEAASLAALVAVTVMAAGAVVSVARARRRRHLAER